MRGRTFALSQKELQRVSVISSCKLPLSKILRWNLTRMRKFSALAVLATAVSMTALRASAQFETRSTTLTGSTLSATALGDFNRDGKVDIAAADASLQIFLGNGDGTFGVALNYLSSIGTIYVATADFNHDGKLDLAVADLNGLHILMGNGDGTFQTPVLYTTPCIPTFIATGDFNNDHKPDLLVTFSGGCVYVGVFLGNGDGTFQTIPIETTPLYSPAAVGIGDFNRDGKLDIAVGEQFGMVSQVEIMSGNGDGTFSFGQVYPVGSFPTAATTADFRNNGELDLAVATLYGGTAILLGNGDGTFTPGATLDLIECARLLSADFNGDGKPDLAVTAQSFPAGVNILLGNGDGTFQAPTFYLEGKEANFVAAADLNGDHKTDLIVTDYTGDSIALLNTGVANFSPNAPINFPFQLVGTASPAQTVTLTNTGSKALSISSMKIASPFLQTNSCGKSVAPSAKCNIEITFKPQNTNTVSGTLTISDSASTKPQIVEVSGTGTVVKLGPSKLAFGGQKVGTSSAPQRVMVSNQGATALSLTQIYVGGTNYRDFSQSNNCPSSLNAGANCVVTVTFSPIKSGARSALLGFIDNGGGSPQTVPLTGTGD